MHLDARDVREIAQFLSRRCTPDGGPPGPAAEAAWERHLHVALDDGTLPKVVRGLAARWPHDENLQAAARLLAPRRLRTLPALAMVAMAALVAGAVVASISGLDRPPVAAPPLQPQSVAAAVSVPQEAAVAPAPPPPPLQPQSVAAVRPELVAKASPCGAQRGEVVGWWHAGAQSPGEVGEVVTLARAVNVRSFYPNESNRFSLRSEVLCVLDAGARVRLGAAPVAIPGGAWWVPVTGGDVVDDAVAAL